MAFKFPTRLKKMKLNSVDFVERGANPDADIKLCKSADYYPESEMIDVEKAEYDLTTFTDVLGESFSSIMADETLTDAERVGMVAKSLNEFNDTVGEYMEPFGIVATQKSGNPRKGAEKTMADLVNVDKSLLTPEEAAMLDALIKKASTEEETPEETPFSRKKVNPEKAQKEAEEGAGLPPEVEKALAEVAEMKKSYEMRELEAIAKKYEILGKKPQTKRRHFTTLRSQAKQIITRISQLWTHRLILWKRAEFSRKSANQAVMASHHSQRVILNQKRKQSLSPIWRKIRIWTTTQHLQKLGKITLN